MASEGLHNLSLQVPVSLARRLDAKCEMVRKASPGTGSRSNIIRAALDQFLADVPDPKAAADGDETVARKYSRPREYRPRKRTIQPIAE